MAWEIAITITYIGAALVCLFLAFRSGDEQERRFPIRLIFITLALLFIIMSLRSNPLIIQANNSTIGGATAGNLTAIADSGYIVMNYAFYFFVIVTVLALLSVAVEYLTTLFRRRR